MTEIIKKILYKIINWMFEFHKIYSISILKKQLILKDNAKLYHTTRILNYSNNPENIVVESNSHIRGELFVFKSGGKISIGKYSFVGENSRIWSKSNIKIGNNVLISHNVNIIDTNSHHLNAKEREKEFKGILKEGFPENDEIEAKPIIIGDNVWISFNAIILKGVKIGKGSIIGAGCIITKDVDPNTIVISDIKNKTFKLC